MPWWLSVAAGAALGCLYRMAFSVNGDGPQATLLTMSLGFLTLVPLVMGYITVGFYLRKASGQTRWFQWFFLPWLSVLITMAVSVAVKWEGAICLIFAAPIMLVFSLIGGVLARIFSGRSIGSAPGQFSAATFPLIVILLESHFAAPVQIRTVETDKLIHAPAAVVWDNIKSVPAIRSSELPGSWVTRIGFPKPVAATLSTTAWAACAGRVSPADSFHGNDPSMGSGIGSDVLHPRQHRFHSAHDARRTRHHRRCILRRPEWRVSTGAAPGWRLPAPYQPGALLTHFNPYAGVWTDAVMRSIQNQILAVIRTRVKRPKLRAGRSQANQYQRVSVPRRYDYAEHQLAAFAASIWRPSMPGTGRIPTRSAVIRSGFWRDVRYR